MHSLIDSVVEGLLMLSLLIGASIVCTTDMQPRFLGMPTVSVIGYGLAILLEWNHLVSFSGTTVIIGLIAGFVIFLTERFVYCRKKRKSGK